MDPYGDGSVRMTQTVSLHTHTRQIPYLLRSVVCVVVTLQQMKSDGELYVAVRKTVCVCVSQIHSRHCLLETDSAEQPGL